MVFFGVVAILLVVRLGSAQQQGADPVSGFLAAPVEAQAEQEGAAAAHESLFEENRFPSATTCQTCHPDHFREWSVSAHAYAQLSPVFNTMQEAVFQLTNGTNGDFCIRCHTPVGMNLEEPEVLSNMDRHPTSREGITCVVCHRLTKPYGKVSGRLSIAEGDIFDPVYGPDGDARLSEAIQSGEFNLNTDRSRSGRNVHTEVVQFAQINSSGFCGTCHDVNLVNGFRLEEAFSEFKTSPAAKSGTTCQDCHMGREPGVASGYAVGPAATIGDRPTVDRKITSHMFAGPDYSILHPGVFPHNVDASRLATIAEWLSFDFEDGWGTDDFELDVPEGFEFPERWAAIDDRYDARDIISDNQELLAEIGEQRLAVLRAGYQIGDIVVDKAGAEGIEFKVEFRNGTDGHNVPTGFDAERIVWLNVEVVDVQGNVVFESGDLDPNGDVRDSHSLYVHNGDLPRDTQLFSLQSNFLTRMIYGGEREQVLPINFSPDPLPFVRPSTSSTVLTGRPVGARKHRMTIYPLGSQWASYRVDRNALAGTSGPYTARVRIKAGMVPPNLNS